jgi:hypothetical protein
MRVVSDFWNRASSDWYRWFDRLIRAHRGGQGLFEDSASHPVGGAVEVRIEAGALHLAGVVVDEEMSPGWTPTVRADERNKRPSFVRINDEQL